MTTRIYPKISPENPLLLIWGTTWHKALVAFPDHWTFRHGKTRHERRCSPDRGSFGSTGMALTSGFRVNGHRDQKDGVRWDGIQCDGTGYDGMGSPHHSWAQQWEMLDSVCNWPYLMALCTDGGDEFLKILTLPIFNWRSLFNHREMALPIDIYIGFGLYRYQSLLWGIHHWKNTLEDWRYFQK